MSVPIVRTLTRIVVCFASLAAMALSNASCTSSPAIVEREVSPSIDAASPPLTSEKDRRDAAGLASEQELDKDVYFNLMPVSHSSRDTEQARSGIPGASAPSTDSEAVSRAPGPISLHGLPDADLVAELVERRSKEWAEITGGLGDASPGEAETRRLAAAKQILALCFLKKDHGLDDEVVLEAARAAAADGAADDLRLLAAAYAMHAGRSEEAAKLIDQLSLDARRRGEPEAKEEDEPSESRVEFQVASLAFARSIEGPGKYVACAASEIAPGKQVLVYGELRNFKNVQREKQDATEPAFRRGFSAVLRLVSSSGDEVDRLEFLPAERGRQTATSPADLMNFWARYRIPTDLAPGSYKITVDAKDILGKAEATASIPFEVGSN